MASPDTTTPVTDAPAVDAPVADAPVAETPAAVAPAPAPVADDAVTVVSTTVPAQVTGPDAPVKDTALVHETTVRGDNQVTDHSDPRGTRDRFGGIDNGPQALPSAPADARTPEQKLS